MELFSQVADNRFVGRVGQRLSASFSAVILFLFGCLFIYFFFGGHIQKSSGLTPGSVSSLLVESRGPFVVQRV